MMSRARSKARRSQTKERKMIRKTLVAVLSCTMLGAPARAIAQNLPIEWTISPRSEAADSVQLSLSYRTPRGGHSMNSRPRLLSELQGLTPAHLASQGGPAAFRIVRQAGTLDCRGVAGGGRGAGECAFNGNPDFAAQLERRGIGRPTPEQQYQLAMQDVGLDLVAELDRQGYRPITVDKLVAAGIHRVTVPYLRSLAEAGYRPADMNGLIAFRIHRVDADYIRGIEPLNGSARFTPDEIVAMRIHRVSAEQARQLAELGYNRLGHKQLMSMAIHRVTPDYIRGLAAAGYRNLAPEQLVSMRIHGVTPEFARRMRGMGEGGTSAEELVRMRIHGLPSRPAQARRNGR
jgi:hypothetical protein